MPPKKADKPKKPAPKLRRCCATEHGQSIPHAAACPQRPENRKAKVPKMVKRDQEQRWPNLTVAIANWVDGTWTLSVRIPDLAPNGTWVWEKTMQGPGIHTLLCKAFREWKAGQRAE